MQLILLESLFGLASVQLILLAILFGQASVQLILLLESLLLLQGEWTGVSRTSLRPRSRIEQDRAVVQRCDAAVERWLTVTEDAVPPARGQR